MVTFVNYTVLKSFIKPTPALNLVEKAESKNG